MDYYERRQARQLSSRLREARRFIQVVSGPRQVGKTTLVRKVIDSSLLPSVYASADAPGLRSGTWIEQQWELARAKARGSARSVILALDEIQKLPDWSAHIKRLWDEDSGRGIQLHVVLLGSAPILIQQGLADSLAGRFEVLHLGHWSLVEMREAFGFDLDAFLYFGGYPGAAGLVNDSIRWSRYVRDSLIETTISRDVLLLSRVDKPALLRRLFELGCRYSGQILSYQKMLGQLQDAGSTVTLAHYLDLLRASGMLAGLQKHAGQAVRRRGSSPKFQVFTTALITAQSGLEPSDVLADPEYRGRLVESAVGAHLLAAEAAGECSLHYWRDRNREVDFVVEKGGRLTAIEVKSGRSPFALPGMEAFDRAFAPDRKLLVGGDGIPVSEFLQHPVLDWIE
jgi:uncharacterized protein